MAGATCGTLGKLGGSTARIRPNFTASWDPCVATPQMAGSRPLGCPCWHSFHQPCSPGLSGQCGSTQGAWASDAWPPIPHKGRASEAQRGPYRGTGVTPPASRRLGPKNPFRVPCCNVGGQAHPVRPLCPPLSGQYMQPNSPAHCFLPKKNGPFSTIRMSCHPLAVCQALKALS
jgi:hypothetical protein